MTTQQQLFRLHWKNHSPNFVTVFSQLLDSSSLVDVTLAADGRQIQAHRVVLSACSTYFQELFVSHPSQHPIVILKDINFKDLCTVIHFMYYGEVNVQQDQLKSILKTAEILHVKGFADVADKESFSAALLTQQTSSVEVPHSSSISQHYSEQSYESIDDYSAIKRKRYRHGSGTGTQSKSLSQDYVQESAPPRSPQSRREIFHVSREGTASSFRSSSSFESSVIRSQSSLVGQSSLESNADNDNLFRDGESKHPLSPSESMEATSVAIENGSALSSSQAKQKRHRQLTRQERVTRKEGDKDPCNMIDNERASPIIQNLQPILPKSPKPSEQESLEPRRIQSGTYLQLPSVPAPLVRQRSQPSHSGSSGTVNTVLPASSTASSSTPTPPPSVPLNIPTLAVTPVSTTPNIVIEQYPTILRVVSIEEMNSEYPASSVPTLTRTPSQLGSAISSNTLQVPGHLSEGAPLSPTLHSSSRLRVKPEENLRRSVSNPGVSHSPPVTAPSSNGHCPVLRTGAALGCNYCWNTNDSHGRILRRKTKYHCPDCQANLCIVPCFQEYHEKLVSSSNEPKPGASQHKGSPNSHQVLSKMSSI